MKKPELLSPAGNFESLKMAVMAGATAVYFGAKNFNARAKAQNFGEDFNRAVAFAHMYGVKVYLTLNTLVENDEIKSLCQTIQDALKAGVDAFIVQDFGVVNILKNCFPSAIIHASTQMAINNYEGAFFAEKMGIKRIVLSRETSLEDIKSIKQNTKLEIEYFVQGALCVCFSGNCYLSSCLYGKSGNRGECLQPCRLPYKAILKGKEVANGYLLSAKDFNMSKRLKDLIDAGVDSFKIEGRLRRPAYVYEATKTYRDIIDNNYIVSNNQTQALKKAFNRGDYTEGYFNGNGNIIDEKVQGHKGIQIGNVVDFNKGNKFNVLTIKASKINRGDVLKIFYNGVEQATITAFDVKQKGNLFEITTTTNLKVGSQVNLILDFAEEEKALSCKVCLPIKFTLTALANRPLKLEYSLIYGINSEPKELLGSVIGEVCQKANSIPLSRQSALESMQKLSETYFDLKDFELITDGVFVTKKQLNEIRRKAIEQIEEHFLKESSIYFDGEYINNTLNFIQHKKQSKTIEFGECYNSKADFYIVKPSNYLTYDYSKITHKNAFLYVPSFLPNNDLIAIKDILQKHKNLGVYATNIGSINLSKRTILGAKLNIKNIFAVKELLNENVVLIETSPELSQENFNIINSAFSIDIVQSSFNNFELMTLVHCPIKTIYKNNCANCKYVDGIEYRMQDGTLLKLKRQKIVSCLFYLVKE